MTGPLQFTPYRPWSQERVNSRLKNFFWNGERGQRGKKMWADGASFQAIADALGATRSAVAGYIRRSGLRRYKPLPAALIVERPVIPPVVIAGLLPAPPVYLALPKPASLPPWESPTIVECPFYVCCSGTLWWAVKQGRNYLSTYSAVGNTPTDAIDNLLTFKRVMWDVSKPAPSEFIVLPHNEIPGGDQIQCVGA